jgi:(2Fe-2S) ferredoxin
LLVAGCQLSVVSDQWLARDLATSNQQSNMPAYERHIFICANQRIPGHPRGCCDPSGQGALQKLFKKSLHAHGLTGRVRANKAGCLDQCEHGPTVVVYPDAVWYGGVTPDDVDEIVESHIVNGVPVERLRLAEGCIATAECPHKPRKRAAEAPAGEPAGAAVQEP